MLKALEDFIILIGFIGGGFIGVKLYKQVDSSYDPNRIESYAKAFFIGGLIGAAIFAAVGSFVKIFIIPLVIILLVIGVVLHFSDKTDNGKSETTDANSEQDLQEENIKMQNDVEKNNVTPRLNSEVSNQNVSENISPKQNEIERNRLLPSPKTTTISPRNSIQTLQSVTSEPTISNVKKFCSYCGAKLRPNSKFCGSCGNPTNQ